MPNYFNTKLKCHNNKTLVNIIKIIHRKGEKYCGGALGPLPGSVLTFEVFVVTLQFNVYRNFENRLQYVYP